MNARVVAICVGLAVAVGAVVGLRALRTAPSSQAEPPAPAVSQAAPKAAADAQPPLPRLLDLGAGKCVPCRMMAPILEEMRREYSGAMTVQFIDVWENPDPAREYGIRIIPTQIFFAPDGKELFRHEGFYAKADILAKWKELGFDIAPSARPGAQ